MKSTTNSVFLEKKKAIVKMKRLQPSVVMGDHKDMHSHIIRCEVLGFGGPIPLSLELHKHTLTPSTSNLLLKLKVYIKTSTAHNPQLLTF